jgi:DNA-directed RNA polymerase specialized sigma24 family protein
VAGTRVNPMENPKSEPNSDLEWMLLSGQPSQGELLEVLLEEFYSPIYRLGLFLLEDTAAASASAAEVFVSALLNAYTYRGSTGVRVWLYQLAVKIYLEKRRNMRPGLAFLGKMSSGIGSPAAAPPALSMQEQWIWSSLDASGAQARYIAFLHFGLGLQATEIAQIQDFKASDVQASLAATAQRLTRLGSDSTPAFDDPFLFTELNQFMLRRWPSPQMQVADQASLASQIVLQAGQSDANRRKLASLKEMLLVGAIILVVIGLTWGVNRFIPEPQPTPYPTSSRFRPAPTRTSVVYFVQPGDSLDSIAARLGMTVEKLVAINAISTTDPLYSGEALWVDISTSLKSEPTPVTPLPPPEPLDLNSSSQAIEKRLKQSAYLWYTLWADIQNFPNGPGSTVGLNNEFRDQIWVSQPDQSLELFGLPENQVYLRRIATGGRGYTATGRPGDAYIDNNWFPIFGENVLRNPLLQALIFPGESDWFRPGWTFNPVASEIIAGRQSLVVDWTNPQGVPEARLWIDALTGVILRRQSLDVTRPDRVVSEMVMTDIAYDVDIPASLFDPQASWQGGFANDYTGKPVTK